MTIEELKKQNQELADKFNSLEQEQIQLKETILKNKGVIEYLEKESKE